jgi:hypothetical protein
VTAGPTPQRRPSSLALGIVGMLVLGWLAMAGHAAWATMVPDATAAETRALVRALDLTDAAWFTEARYTRHLGLADDHAAFQDGPGAREHFPSGALVPPPRHGSPAGLTVLPEGA